MRYVGWGNGGVRRYDARLPQLSDIAFATDSGGAWSPAAGIALPITPVNVTDESGRAWLYFEAYGLSPKGEYGTEIRMEPRDGGEPFSHGHLFRRRSMPAAPQSIPCVHTPPRDPITNGKQ
jgi:hypothetical protein